MVTDAELFNEIASRSKTASELAHRAAMVGSSNPAVLVALLASMMDERDEDDAVEQARRDAILSVAAWWRRRPQTVHGRVKAEAEAREMLEAFGVDEE